MNHDLAVLFTPFDLAGLTLPNRFVMSPMTRSRAPASGVPDELTARYYAQRAGAGLVIAEGTTPMAGGASFPGVPAAYAPEHVTGCHRRWETRPECQSWTKMRPPTPSLPPAPARWA